MIKLVLKYLLGLFFVLAGVNHFVNAAAYVKIMPPYLPWPLALVYVSGVCEVVLGAMLLCPTWSWLAAWGLIALLIAVFPANLHMALNPNEYAKFTLPILWLQPRPSHLSPTALWLRLPLQAVFIAWAYWYTRD